MTETYLAPMPTPTVHLNGTSRDALVEQRSGVHRALEALIRAMAEACPNGRDYYPRGGGAIHEALDVYESRIRWLRALQRDLQREVEEIADQ